MDSYFGYKEIKALKNLISSSKDDSDSDDDLRQNDSRKLGPGNVFVQKEAPIENVRPHAPLKGINEKDIWHPSEASDVQSTETYDSRQVPSYEMKFKQAVRTEDLFLGMGFKTPGTASCEWLSIFVKLPQEDREKVELSVESDAIDVRSPKYRLHLPTPHSVDPNTSSAKWHNDTQILEITLRLIRELDNINF